MLDVRQLSLALLALLLLLVVLLVWSLGNQRILCEFELENVSDRRAFALYYISSSEDGELSDEPLRSKSQSSMPVLS